MRSSTLIVALAITLAPRWLAAQPSMPPDSVLRAFFDATLEQRWLEAAQFVDQTRIDMARWEVIRSARQPARVRSVEDYLRDDPRMPRQVAEYFVKSAGQSMRKMGNHIPYQFADVEDTVALQQLSQLEAAARYVQAKDPRYHLRLSYRTAPGCQGKSLSDADVNELAPRFELLTTAVRGDTAWVMFRDTSRTGFIGPGIATLFRQGSRWFVDIDQPQYGPVSLQMFTTRCDEADSAAVRRP